MTSFDSMNTGLQILHNHQAQESALFARSVGEGIATLHTLTV